MNAKQKFIEMVEMLINAYNVHDGVETPLNLDLKYTEALAYFETLKVEKTKEKVAFTDNGKLILQYMIDNIEQHSNLFKARDIADGTFISSRSVSGSMRKLITDGYVEKMGAEPIVYSLTDLGKSVKFE